MNELSKSLSLPHRAKVWSLLCGLTGLDIGAGPDPLYLSDTTVHTWDQEPGATFNGDAQYLSCLPEETYDFVHSSHCLEHMQDVNISLSNWARVLKPGGLLIVTVPEHHFYERGIWPSPFNSDHKQRFSCMPLPDEPNCWPTSRVIQLSDSLGLELLHFWLELDKFDFAAHASRFLVDQTLADATAQLCYCWRKIK